MSKWFWPELKALKAFGHDSKWFKHESQLFVYQFPLTLHTSEAGGEWFDRRGCTTTILIKSVLKLIRLSKIKQR